MGNFTKQITKTYEFDGDIVTVTMTRLRRIDAMVLTPFIKQYGDGSVKMSFGEQIDFINTAADILPNCIKSFSGLFIEGVEVTRESEEFNIIMEDMYFMSLLSDILKDITVASFVSNEEKKDIKKPQENISEDSATINNLSSEV